MLSDLESDAERESKEDADEIMSVILPVITGENEKRVLENAEVKVDISTKTKERYLRVEFNDPDSDEAKDFQYEKTAEEIRGIKDKLKDLEINGVMFAPDGYSVYVTEDSTSDSFSNWLRSRS